MPSLQPLASLAHDAETCTACPLYRDATQTVFGRGPETAAIMLVGEQPGDAEDRAGVPFVGPAGRILDEAIALSGLSRPDLYVTNVVKHFKWEARGKRRIHKKPNLAEVEACGHWLVGELRAVRPKVVVALGATAARAIIARDFKVGTDRGKLVSLGEGISALGTIHPSAIVRLRDRADREQQLAEMARDLATAASAAR